MPIFRKLILAGCQDDLSPAIVMQSKEVKDIYAIFSKYKPGNPVTGHYCPVCLSDDDNTYFQTTPLHLIEPVRLSRYFSAVGIMDNGATDFKYFIPRILEIVFNDEDDGSFFFDQVWNRLAEAKYTLWQKDEVESIDRLFGAYMQKYIRLKNKRQFELTRDILKDIGYEGATRFSYTE